MVLGVKKIRLARLIRTDADIKAAVKAWCGEWECDYIKGGKCKVRGDPVAAEREYGHISQWDTEQVTSMKDLFFCMTEFNEDISRWRVHNVRDMHKMFYGARSFNQDLSGWDVRKVRDMAWMFDDTDSLEKKPSWYEE